MYRIVTAATASYRPFVQYQYWSGFLYGYETIVYDLAGLGFGLVDVRLQQQAINLDSAGYYQKIGTWSSTAEHKPTIIKQQLVSCLANDILVYLDADAVIVRPLPDLPAEFDFGITLRPEGVQSDHQHFKYRGVCNAGVLFFRPTEITFEFLDRWDVLMRGLGDDQWALNELIGQPTIGIGAGPCESRLLALPGNLFNCSTYADDAYVHHFKGKDRQQFARLHSAALV